MCIRDRDVAGNGGKNVQVIVFEPSDVLIMIFELCHVVCQIFLLTGLKLQLFVGLKCVVKHQKNQDVCCCEAENQDSVEEQNIARIMKQTAENDVDQENTGTDCDLQKQKQLNPRREMCIRDRFYRTDASRNSMKGGSGIGLSIVKKIKMCIRDSL